MGCNTNKNAERNPKHCARCDPSGNIYTGQLNMSNLPDEVTNGIPFQHERYDPIDGVDKTQYEDVNVPEWERDLVMYCGTVCEQQNPPPPFNCGTAGDCGKIIISLGGSNPALYGIMSRYPSGISFEPLWGDQWFYYLFDTSRPIAGYPCYYLEDTDGTTSGTDPDGNPTSSTSYWGQTCHPCKSFTCEAGASTIEYTTQEGSLVEGRDPFPTIWTAGTRTNAIAFRYEDGIPTTTPQGPVDFSITPTGGSATDCWEASNSNGIPIDCPENPWSDPDDIGASYILVFDELNSATGTGLRIKMRYEPRTTGDPATIVGSTIYIDELMNAGVNYQVGDNFNLSIPIGGAGSIDFNFAVTAIGDIQTSNPYANYALLNAADTVNGHIIEKVKHMDLNFNYHIAEISGDGSDFAKDTTYTTSRGNQITVLAGFGIPDRAFLGGLFEFRNKSMQYMTADLNRQPNSFNDYRQPSCKKTVDVMVTQGSSTVTLVNGGDTQWIKVGYNFRAAFFAENSYITAVNGTSFTVSSTCTGTNTGPAIKTRADITNIEIVNGQIKSMKIADGGMGWNKLNSKPIVTIATPLKETGIDAVIDYEFSNGVLSSLEVKSSGSMYPQGEQIDIAIPMTHKEIKQKLYSASTTYEEDPANEPLNEALARPEITSIPRFSDKVFVDSVTASGLSPKDYNTEGVEVNDYEHYKRIMQRAADDMPDGLDRLYFQTNLTMEDIRKGMAQAPYTDVTHQYQQNEVKDLKRLPNVIRTERVGRALPDREDMEDLRWRTLDERMGEGLRAGGFASQASTMQDFVDADKIRKDEFIELNSESPEVTSSGKKLVKFDKEEVRTVHGSFYDLPCASAYTKYLLRQYIPDSRVTANINVKLAWEPLNPRGCGDNTQGDCFGTSGQPGSSGNTTYSSTISGPFGEGCKAFNVEGSIKVYNDLTNSAYLFGQACDKAGNPFDFKCT